MKKMTLLISFIALLFFNSSVHASCVPGSTDPECQEFSPSPSPYSSGDNDLQPPVFSPSSDPDSSSPSNSPSYLPANAPYSYSDEDSYAPGPSENSSYDDDFLPVEDPDVSVQEENSPSSSSKSVDPAVNKICDSTDHAELCLASIKPFLTSGAISDPMSILKLEIKAATEAAKLAQAAAEKISSLPTTSETIVSALDDCKEMYDSVMGNLQEATQAVADRDIGTMNSMLSAVISDLGTCTDGFEGSICPVEEQNNVVTQLASNCLAIVGLLK